MTNTSKTPSDKVRVFVYGSLKQGQGNHLLLERSDAKYLGRDTITGAFTMVSFGGFPAVCHDSSVVGDKVVGEVYEVDQDTFLTLDALEGHPRWYKREKYTTDNLKARAWIYLQPESVIKTHEPVPFNCWRMTNDEEEWLNELDAA
jgi:gamma-glutamylaminecyclotransferase